MVQVEQLFFANIELRQKGSKKLSGISPLAWLDMHKMTASSLRFQILLEKDLNNVLKDWQCLLGPFDFLLWIAIHDS